MIEEKFIEAAMQESWYQKSRELHPVIIFKLAAESFQTGFQSAGMK